MRIAINTVVCFGFVGHHRMPCQECNNSGQTFFSRYTHHNFQQHDSVPQTQWTNIEFIWILKIESKDSIEIYKRLVRYVWVADMSVRCILDALYCMHNGQILN